MKKSLIALAVLAASGASFAQSVTMYGVADVWFGLSSGTGVESQTLIGSGGAAGSRWGIKGSEDLGGGLKANFVLEQGFAIDTGAAGLTDRTFASAKAGIAAAALPGATATSIAAAQDAQLGGQAFARLSYVGFSGGFGEVKLGKMWTAYDDIAGAGNSGFDTALSAQKGVFVTNGYASNPGSSVYYASPTMSGFKGAISYSLGENKTATADAGSVVAFNVQYAAGPAYAGLAYQTEKYDGSTNAVNFTRLNGTYDFGVAKLLAGYGRFSTDAGGKSLTTNEYEIGADFPVSKQLTLSAGIARSDDNDAIAVGGSRTGYGLVAAYTLSKRTMVYGGFHAATAKASGLADSDSKLFAVGVNHSF